MSQKRGFSGTRNGTGAFIRTLGELKQLTNNEKSAKKLDDLFRKNFKEDYPDTTDVEATQKKKILIENHVWGNGKTLGKASDVVEMTKKKNNTEYQAFIKAENKRIDQHEKTVVANQPITESGRNLEAEYDKIMDTIAQEYGQEVKERGDKMQRALSQRPAIKERKIRRKEVEQVAEALEKAKLLTSEGMEKQGTKLNNAQRKEAFRQLMEYARESKARKKDKARDQEELDKKKDTEKKEEEEYYKAAEKYYKTPETLRGGEPPKPPRANIAPFDPKSIIPEEDHKAEKQFKKITRKNVGKIDDGVKTDKEKLNTHVDPTVNLSDIQKALNKQKDRMKLRPAKITYHRLGKPIATATRDTF